MKRPLWGSASNLPTGRTSTEFRSCYVPSLTVVQKTIIVQGVTIVTATGTFIVQGVTVATATVTFIVQGVTVATVTVTFIVQGVT